MRGAIAFCRLALSLELLLVATPLAAQEPTPSPPVERLEQLRFERLREALQLDDERARDLQRALEEARRSNGEAIARHRGAMENLRRALASEPTDDDAVRRALEAVEAEREAMERLRAEERRRLSAILTPRQQARFMLFNRQFDDRLRDLLNRRKAPRPGFGPQQGPPGRPPRGDEAARLRQRIEELQRRLQEIERERAD